MHQFATVSAARGAGFHVRDCLLRRLARERPARELADIAGRIEPGLNGPALETLWLENDLALSSQAQ